MQSEVWRQASFSHSEPSGRLCRKARSCQTLKVPVWTGNRGQAPRFRPVFLLYSVGAEKWVTRNSPPFCFFISLQKRECSGPPSNCELKKTNKHKKQLLPVNIQIFATRMGLRAFGPGTLGSKAVSFFCCVLPDVCRQWP